MVNVPTAVTEPLIEPPVEPLVEPAGQEETVIEPPPAKKHVTFAFVGDVLLSGGVEKILDSKGYDYPYQNVQPYLSEPDITIANLETPVTENGTPQDKEYVYKTNPQYLPALKDSGVDVVNLANNHSMDQGELGLVDTLQHLQSVELPFVGAGMNEAEAFAPVYIEKNGIKVAVLGFSRVVPEGSWYAGLRKPGLATTYDPTKALKAIQLAKQNADLVVVIAHWGIEREDTPEKYQVNLAHQYIDSGADLVIGGHPHVLQGFEAYNGKWIAYSLGNFIFTTNGVPKTWETLILQADCTQEAACSMSIVPVLTKYASPTPMEAEAGAKLIQRLNAINRNVRISDAGELESQ
ncbi:CapA family protein [Paenibacillus cremeus]|uniref:CapA family protein n=2 Tax=Paenibacillus cremeus TaxID=2163881 RepID=A0A559K7X0_9BACL|nr:CapA family protein [Paenibacillus cremeus]